MNECLPGPLDGGSALVSERRVSRAIGNITIKCFRIDAESSEFGALAPFHTIWRSKLRGDGLPRWKDFDFEEFVGWHRYIALGDITPDSADPLFRLWGSGITEVLGEDLTGKTLTEAVPASATDGVIDHFAEIRDQRLIGMTVGKTGMRGREFIDFASLELPLVNDDGEVSQILYCYVRLKPQD